MKRTFIFFLCLFFLTGCWSNLELDQTALVHGVGLDEAENGMLKISFEIVKPGGNVSDSGGTQNIGNQTDGEHIVLEETTDSLLDGARKLIRYTKRRLDFGHTEAWIISEKLAEQDFVQTLDVIRRDQMLRLNSHIFVTKDDPTIVLNTSTFYENLVATELAASIEQTHFIAQYAPITIREFFKDIEGPIGNGYIPLIYLVEVNENKITSIEGTAVIKDNRMVGELNEIETAGLNMLINHVNGGSIRAFLNDEELVSLEVFKLKTETTPKLDGKKLEADIEIEVKGTLADNMTNRPINEEFLREVEEKISERTKNIVRLTLNKLQKELKTDLTDIGKKIHRKYPKQWQEISSDWDEMFANAKFTIHVDTTVTHQGLLNENIHHNEKPYKNPYLFWK